MLLDQLGAYLQSRGLGTVGTDLFLGKLPEVAGTVVGLLEYGGEPSIYTMTRVVLETPRLQVVARAQNYAPARARVQGIYEALDGWRGGPAMPGVYWIEALGPPFRIGLDERLRELVGVNLRCHHAHPAPVAGGVGEAVGVGVVERSAIIV